MAVIPQGLTAPIATLTVAGRNIISPIAGAKNGVPLDSIEITDNGINAASTLTFTHEDPALAYALPAGAEMTFQDFRAGTPVGPLLFGGYLVSRELVPGFGPGGLSVRCICTDYSLALDRRVLVSLWQTFINRTVQDILTNIMGYIGFPMPASCPSDSTVIPASTAAPLAFQGIPARSIVEQLVSRAQGIANTPFGYLTIPAKYLFILKLSAWTYAQPANITDAAPSAGLITADKLTLEYDESAIINSVYVRGSSKANSVWVNDTASQTKYGVRQGIVDQPSATSLTAATNYGRAYLIDHKDAVVRGHFEVEGAACYAPASGSARHWNALSTFTLTNTALGLAASSLRASSVRTWFVGGNGAHRHEVYFGGLPPSGTARIVSALTSAGVGINGTAALPTSAQRLAGTAG
jgi:hypothetical protein